MAECPSTSGVPSLKKMNAERQKRNNEKTDDPASRGKEALCPQRHSLSIAFFQQYVPSPDGLRLGRMPFNARHHVRPDAFQGRTFFAPSGTPRPARQFSIRAAPVRSRNTLPCTHALPSAHTLPCTTDRQRSGANPACAAGTCCLKNATALFLK